MSILISDLEANTSLDAQAMNALIGGCCYCCPPPPPCYCRPRPWCGWGFKPTKVRRIRGRRLNLRVGLRIGMRAVN